jgi:hypothetical protein
MLTTQERLQFANEWSPAQIQEFAQRAVACATPEERRAILREFSANLPNPEYNTHPQIVKLQAACFAASAK